MNKEILEKALKYQYIHRKKNNYKNKTINLRKYNFNYSQLKYKLTINDIALNYKILSELLKSELLSVNSLIKLLK
jgi:ribosomal protein L20